MIIFTPPDAYATHPNGIDTSHSHYAMNERRQLDFEFGHALDRRRSRKGVDHGAIAVVGDERRRDAMTGKGGQFGGRLANTVDARRGGARIEQQLAALGAAVERGKVKRRVEVAVCVRVDVGACAD